MSVDRHSVFKALGDSTRYAVYEAVAEAPAEVTTAEVAVKVDVHPNTVRAHLDRLREVGLVQMSIDAHGAVGRPQHRWTVSASAPSLGLEPSGFRLLSHLLAEAVASSAASPVPSSAASPTASPVASSAADPLRLRTLGHDAVNSGRVPAAQRRHGPKYSALVEREADLGFDPVAEEEGNNTTVAFLRCPFRELATAFPDVVCSLHRGLTEGLAEQAGLEVCNFETLVDPHPCRVEVTPA